MYILQNNRTGGIPTKYNLLFLASFSTLSTLLHLLPISQYYHNILFSANIFSLIGATMITIFFPTRLFMKYGKTFSNIIQQLGLSNYIDANVYTLNTVAWILHVIPVAVLYYYKFTLGNPIGWMLLYLVFIFALSFDDKSSTDKSRTLSVVPTSRVLAIQYSMIIPQHPPSAENSNHKIEPTKPPPMVIEKIYNMNIIELAFVAITTSVIFMGVYMVANTRYGK